MKSMKLGMIWVLGGWDWQCSSQWGLDSAQSVSAQDSTDPVFVGAGDRAMARPAQVTKLLPNSSTTSSTLHPLQQRSSPPETTRTTKAPYLSTIPATALNLLPTPTGASSRLSQAQPRQPRVRDGWRLELLRLLQRDALSTGAEHTRQPWIDAGEATTPTTWKLAHNLAEL